MSIEQINDKLKDFPELLKEVSGYKSGFDVNSENITRIGQLEIDRDKAIHKRDDIKAVIRSITGLDEISEENLKGAFGGTNDAFNTLKQDNETLQGKLQALRTDFDSLDSKHETEIGTMIMLDQLRSMGVDEQVHNQNALEHLAKDMLEGSQRDNGIFSFKDNEGKTLFNDSGVNFNLNDKLDSLKEDSSKYYFKQTQGGGYQSNNNDQSSKAPVSSTDSDIAKYFEKHGRLPDTYGK